ncbi:MAG: hypothetical protein ABJB47_02060, partial [Actinomycetota bacterium]
MTLARQTGDTATEAEALRHLDIAAHRAGQLEVARQQLEESTRLRREQGLMPGVAVNMVGLTTSPSPRAAATTPGSWPMRVSRSPTTSLDTNWDPAQRWNDPSLRA